MRSVSYDSLVIYFFCQFFTDIIIYQDFSNRFLGVYDPININGELAFWVKTETDNNQETQAIIKATELESELTVNISASPETNSLDPIHVRDNLKYTITVKNTSVTHATNVELILHFDGKLLGDNLVDDGGLNQDKSIVPGNSTQTDLPVAVLRSSFAEDVDDINYQSGSVHFSLGAINSGAEITREFVITPLEAGPLRITPELSSDRNDDDRAILPTLTNINHIASLVFRIDKNGQPWIGWDHVGLNVDGLIYEAHPGYNTLPSGGSRTKFYDPGLGAGGHLFSANDVGVADYSPWFGNTKKNGVFVNDFGQGASGIIQTHTLGSFLYDSDSLDQTTVEDALELEIPYNLAQQMANKIKEVMPYGVSEYAISGNTIEQVIGALKAMNSIDFQKGGIDSETGKRTFTCVGLLEWAAEQVGYNKEYGLNSWVRTTAQGFIPNWIETFHTGNLKFPALTPQLLLWSIQDEQGWDDQYEAFQGILDPVDFIITDPLDRRLGYTEELGTINEIPGALYSGDGDAEQFFIPDPIPGDYQIQLIGVGEDAFAAMGYSADGHQFEGFLAEGETETFTITVENNYIVVNSTGDVGDANPFDDTPDVDLTTPGLQVTLRSAIQFANANPGLNRIFFDIPTTDPGYDPATGTFTIKPNSALPTITDVIVIDGTTQNGFTNKPIIELNGENADSNLFDLQRVSGLTLKTGNSTIRGLVINRFRSGNGISILDGDNNIIEGNFIGTDITGTDIGDTSDSSGDLYDDPANYDLSRFIGNGLTGGDYDSYDGLSGIFISSTSTGNIIGGTTGASRNVISGNGVGITIEGNNNNVRGNYIGTDVTGTVALGNIATFIGDFFTDDWVGKGIGIAVFGSENLIGGTIPEARNIISGNKTTSNFGDGTGIVLAATYSGTYKTPDRNLIQGNYIGTDVTGTLGGVVTRSEAKV